VGNKFKLDDLIGRNVVVTTTFGKVSGELLMYGLRDKTLFIKNFTVLKENNGKWESVRDGELIVIQKKSWFCFEVR